MRLKVGQQITVRALHADGQCYRWWETTLERVDGVCLVTFSLPGNFTHDKARGSWPLEHAMRGFYWHDRFYNLSEVYDPGGSPIEVYINIGSPPVLRADGFDWTDHELDVSKYADEPARLLDEDEFAEAALKYGYTPEFQGRCYAATHEALALAEAWEYAGLGG
jgi:protein associated with RNAse G/E